MSDKSERKFDVEMPKPNSSGFVTAGMAGYDFGGLPVAIQLIETIYRECYVLAMRSQAQDVIDGLRAELDSFDSIFRGYWAWKELSRYDQLLHMEASWDIERCRANKAETEFATARLEADGLSEICGCLKKELQETQVACAKAREEAIRECLDKFEAAEDIVDCRGMILALLEPNDKEAR